MKMIDFNLHIFSLIFCICINALIGSKLTVPRVLLPIFNDFSTRFILEVIDGDCYKWTTSRSDIIKLVPNNVESELDCSSSVTIFTNTKERTRNMAVILAEDAYTNQVLRCDVIVDVIHSLNIITTTRDIYVEEAPEAFEVRALDVQGNEFTSLEGVEFDWQIIGSTSHGSTNGIHFITFKDSPYATPPSIEKLENDDKKGHIVLLAGTKTGSAKVIVTLPYPEYKNVKGHEVQISVIANLIITPPEAYIMVGDTVTLTVIEMNNGRMENVDLSLSNYELQLENEMVASIDNLMTVTGLETGQTKVMIHDPNMAENENEKLPTCTINVVDPAYMKLSILPYENWAILLSEHHDIVAEVYSNDGYKLHLGKGVKVDIEVDSLFHAHERSNNGSWLTGWAKDLGTAPVNSILHGVVNSKLGTFKVNAPISAHAELLVFSPIILNPSEVILPWDPILKPKYEVEIQALGGDGNFVWSSSNHSIGVATQNGSVRTFYHGQFQVTAAMVRNQYNMRSSTIQILPPKKLEIIEYVMEAEVNEPIFLYVALFATKQKKSKSYFVPFNLCQELPFKVKLSNENFLYNATAIKTPVGISCATVAVVGRTVGVSRVTISYSVEGNLLEDSATINTFEPLRLLHPLQHEIALAVDTSINVIFTGGPKPFVGHPSIYKRNVHSQFETIVFAVDITEANPTKTDDVIVLHVSCKKLGTSGVRLSITNNPLLPNSRNQETYSELNVYCVEPYSIALHPVVKLADSKHCPMDVSANRVIVPSYTDIEVDVIVRDENDRNLLNISSIKLYWFLDSEDTAQVGSTDSVFSRKVTYNNVEYSNGSYQIVTPKIGSGIIKLGVIYQCYFKDKYCNLNIMDCISNENSECIKDEIYLYFSNNVIAEPNQLSIYNHPSSRKRIMIYNGSGYYEIALSSDKIALVKYIETSHEVEIAPLNVGELEITLVDLCLPSQPFIISVSVVTISNIKVKMSDKVEIGKSIPAVITLYDVSDNTITIPDLEILKLTPDLDFKIASVDQTELEGYYSSEEEILYTITGLELGNTKIKFGIGDVVSSSMDLQVFPPLKIIPRNVTLLLGSVFQYSCRGGPQPNNIEYMVVNKTIAGIDVLGLVHTLELGYSKIEASSVGVCPTTGAKIVYSKDEVDLCVIQVKGVKIISPLTRFQVGTTIPLWTSGLPEELSPMILGSTEKPFKFNWRVEDHDIIKIRNPFMKLGIEYLPEDNIIVRAIGLSTGRTTIHLEVIIPGSLSYKKSDSYKVFSDSLEIEVFEGLVLTSPRTVSGEFILMTTHTSMQLETNMDGLQKLEYIVNMPLDKFHVDHISNPLITVSDTGLVEAYDKFGTAHVMITAIDKFGLKQILNIVIEVKPVHYMLLDVITNWRVNSLQPMFKLPLGTEIKIQGHFYDNIGKKFTAANLNLHIRSSRADLISVRYDNDNSSMIVSTRRAGTTVLRGFTSGFHKHKDYIKLHIDQVLVPEEDFITTGDIICPSTPLVDLNKGSGHWKTSDKSLIHINQETGIGYAVGYRNGRVSLSHSLHPSTALHFSLLPASDIIMVHPSQPALTNTPGIPIRIPLVITSDESIVKATNLINGHHCRRLPEENMSYPFICHFKHTADVEDVDTPMFNIQSGFDPISGRYTCDLILESDSTKNVQHLLGNISIWAELSNVDVKATPITLPFIPAISATQQINSDLSVGVLVINGVNVALDQVEVAAVDPEILEVYEGQRPESNILLHKFNILKPYWKLDELGDAMALIVKSPLTNQKIKVKVKRDLPGTSTSREIPFYHSPIINFIYQYQKQIYLGASTFGLLIITLMLYSYFIQPIITVNASGYNNSETSYGNTFIANPVLNTPRNSRSASISTTRNASFTSQEPIYGDPNSFYRSPTDLRRRL